MHLTVTQGELRDSQTLMKMSIMLMMMVLCKEQSDLSKVALKVMSNYHSLPYLSLHWTNSKRQISCRRLWTLFKVLTISEILLG